MYSFVFQAFLLNTPWEYSETFLYPGRIWQGSFLIYNSWLLPYQLCGDSRFSLWNCICLIYKSCISWILIVIDKYPTLYSKQMSFPWVCCNMGSSLSVILILIKSNKIKLNWNFLQLHCDAKLDILVIKITPKLQKWGQVPLQLFKGMWQAVRAVSLSVGNLKAKGANGKLLMTI